MAVVEIHIKKNTIESIEGQDVYVHIHDHDVKETMTMVFKKQEELYDKYRTDHQAIRFRANEDSISNRKVQE
tara:strand:+ start:3437 stop:3652 length:216 start_codon:yes stop_codon:yes gene_type:complete